MSESVLKEDISHFESFVLLAGLSGAGKSTASRAFSDNGYHAIDNLPVSLLSNFLTLSRDNPARFLRTSLLLDVDTTEQCELLLSFINSLDDTNNAANKRALQVLYLDATTQTIVQRYSETRRPHPVFEPDSDNTLADAIQRERTLLLPIRERANLVIDTSDLTPHDLRRATRRALQAFVSIDSHTQLRVNFVSFGFKYGTPSDCDLLIDVRFLPNPYFHDELRLKSGLNKEVSDFVLNTEDATEFLGKYVNLLQFLLPKYIHEGKAYLNIGVGCTGGQHRSVCIAHELAKLISSPEDNEKSYTVSVTDRDVTPYIQP